MNGMRILVGIVSHNQRDCLERCLNSVSRQFHQPCEIVVFDNASTDGSQEYLSSLDQIHAHFSPANIGFAQGHNWILQNFLTFDYYLCLNPMVELSEDFLLSTISSFRHGPSNLGAVNGLVCYLDAKGNKSDRVFSRGQQFFQERRSSEIDSGISYRKLDLEPEYVFGPNRSCPLFSMEMLNDVKLADGNLFEPHFFQEWINEDLAWRMNLHGWKVIFSPMAKAWHQINLPSDHYSPVCPHEMANRYLCVLRNDEWPSLLRSLPIIIMTELCFVLLNSVASPKFLLEYFRSWLKFFRLAPHFWHSRANIRIRIDKKQRESLIKPFAFARLYWLASARMDSIPLS